MGFHESLCLRAKEQESRKDELRQPGRFCVRSPRHLQPRNHLGEMSRALPEVEGAKGNISRGSESFSMRGWSLNPGKSIKMTW